jgi:hypothetical protein
MLPCYVASVYHWRCIIKKHWHVHNFPYIDSSVIGFHVPLIPRKCSWRHTRCVVIKGIGGLTSLILKIGTTWKWVNLTLRRMEPQCPLQIRHSARFGEENCVSSLPGLEHRTKQIFTFFYSYFLNYSGSLHVDTCMLAMTAVKTTNDKMV